MIKNGSNLFLGKDDLNPNIDQKPENQIKLMKKIKKHISGSPILAAAARILGIAGGRRGDNDEKETAGEMPVAHYRVTVIPLAVRRKIPSLSTRILGARLGPLVTSDEVEVCLDFVRAYPGCIIYRRDEPTPNLRKAKPHLFRRAWFTIGEGVASQLVMREPCTGSVLFDFAQGRHTFTPTIKQFSPVSSEDCLSENGA